MTKNETAIIEFTKRAINKNYSSYEKFNNISKSEVEGILKEAKAQAIVSLVLPEILKSSPSLSSEYNNYLLSYVTRNIKVINEHIRVGKALDKAGIDYVVIKGCASGEYYPDILYRSMGDIDVLVRPSDFKKASEIIKTIGYKPFGKYNKHHNSYKYDAVVCELHHIIGYISENEADLSKLTDTIISTRRPMKISGESIYVPSRYYHGFIMLLHVYKHMFSGMGIRHLCDWAVFVADIENKEACSKLYETAKEYRLSKLFKVLTAASKKYFELSSIDADDDTDEKIVDEFVNAMLTSGNFGSKASKEWMNLYINRSYENNISFMARVISAMKNKVLVLQPKAANNKLLFAIWFVFVPFYYLYMCISGKKKIRKIKDSRELAKQKNELFSHLSDKD